MDDRISKTLRFDKDKFEKFRILAIKKNITASDLMNEILDYFFENNESIKR